MRCGRPHEGHHGSSVDDGGILLIVSAEGENGVLASEPDTLHVDVLGEIPDGFGGVDGIVILSRH